MHFLKSSRIFFCYFCFVLILIYLYLLALRYYCWPCLFGIIFWLKCEENWLVHGSSIPAGINANSPTVPFWNIQWKDTGEVKQWHGNPLHVTKKEPCTRLYFYFFWNVMHVLFVRYCHWIIYMESFCIMHTAYFTIHVFLYRY